MVALCAATAAQGQRDSTVGLTAVRFYHPPGGETLVDVFCRIPLGDFAVIPGAGRAAYRITVSARDSAGLELMRRSWSETVDTALLGASGASSAEHFQFVARPGRYGIEVVVTDSASGRARRQQAAVQAFATRPDVSDLLLARGLRLVASDSIARGGEVQKGGLFVETSGRPVATPDQSRIGYYLEVYAPRAETASVAARVLDGAGKQFAATAPQRISVSAGGGATSGLLDLGGLPPGEYRLELTVAGPDSQVVREAWFRMAGFRPPPMAEQEQPAGADSLSELPEAQLDSMYAPLLYLMDPDERGVYPGLTPDGKRAFLRRFWRKRDPTPGTARNEFEELFYRTVGQANTRFREGGAAAVPGWRTDRGRIYIRYGEPDEVLERPQAGSTRPYQVWKYTKVRSRRFVFLDAALLGHYELIWTDERHEPSRPDWQELLGPEALQDVLRF